MDRTRLRNLMFGTMSAMTWAAASQAQEPMPVGRMPLPRIVTPEDSPPAATGPQPPTNPAAPTNPEPPATNPTPAPTVAPRVVEPSPAATVIESPVPQILDPGDGRRFDRTGAIETDRSSFTPSIRTVGRGRLVTESSYSFIDAKDGSDTHSFPELLFRYGLWDRVELRLGFNYEAGGSASGVAGEGGTFLNGGGLEHETNLSYGLKVSLTLQDAWLPESMVIVQGFTPTSGPDPATQYIVTYGWGWQLPNCWKLDASMRYSEDSEAGDRFSLWAPSVVLRVPVGERWTVHAEYFGEMSSGRREEFSKQFISPGLHCLLSENVEVGVRVGWGMNDQSARFFSNVGVGWRF